MSFLAGYVLPGLPHPLLCPEASPSYSRLRAAFASVRDEISSLQPDVLVVYSTMWPSVLGHQVQGRERLQWVHVDDDFHHLGSIPYDFQFHSRLARSVVAEGGRRGLATKLVDYHGFPLDTGTVTALRLLAEEGESSPKRPAIVLSSNVYADRSETVVLAKTVRQALASENLSAVALVISTLSNRLTQSWVEGEGGQCSSLKDHEWNQKILEILSKGRLEDVSQLSRQIHREARVKKVSNFKPFWWLSAALGEHNRYRGNVLAYEAVHGAGCAVVSMTPSPTAARDLEFDEDSPEVYSGDRNVLSSSDGSNPDSTAEAHGPERRGQEGWES